MIEKNYPPKLLKALLRTDFNSFIHKVFNSINPGSKYLPNWHIELIADYLEAVRKGEIKRLIINIPPRALKSVCVSVAWPAWLLGQDPATRIMAASYSQILSIKHSLDTRLVMSSNWYKKIFPQTVLSKNHNQKSKFITTENGFRFATSVGGSATGEGGDFLIIDDPHNPIHIHSNKLRQKVIEWFEQTFLTRLNDKNNGAVVLVMQRLHAEDLSGYLLANNSGIWEHLKIPVRADKKVIFVIGKKDYQYYSGQTLHNLRDQEDQLFKLEQEIGASNFAAQYQQEPLEAGVSILLKEDLSFYEELPQKLDFIAQSWDTAIKTSENSDYSVATCWGIFEEKYYLIEMFRQKLAYPDLKNKVMKLNEKYKPKYILIEDKASGQSIIQDARREGMSNIIPQKPKLDKITRFAACSPLFQSGKVLLPKQAPFNSTMIKELTSFPHSKHDDIIDSCSQFLNFMKEKKILRNLRVRSF